MPASNGSRIARWAVAIVYTLLIYTLAWYVNPMWDWLTATMGTEAGGKFVNRAVPVLGLLVLALVLVRHRFPTVWSYLWLVAVAAGYAFLLTLHAEYPVERIHLIQYSLVAFVYFRALKLDSTDRRSYFGAAFAVFFVGLTDELIQQYFIEGRSGTFADMTINWASGGLGLVALLAIRHGGVWNLHSALRPSLRLVTGLLAPLLLAGFWSHQVYTRYLYPPINLVLITVDCARPDYMGIYGNSLEPPTSQYLDAMAKDGAVFTNMFSQSTWTSPGVASTLTGMYPPTNGIVAQEHSIPKAAVTILDAYKQRGYKVPRLSYLINATPNFLNLAEFDEGVEGINILNELRKILNWIDNNHREPFAMWYHWRFMHLPYNPPRRFWVYEPAVIDMEESQRLAENDIDIRDRMDMPDVVQNVIRKEVIVPYFSQETLDQALEANIPPSADEVEPAHKFSEEAQRWTRAMYAAQMRHFDHAFEAIRYRLSLHNKLKHTIFVITADHGEELFEHGYVGHASTMVHARHYDEQLRIPLIIMAPRLIDRGRKIDVTAQQVDILPTVMDMMNWEIPEGVQGRSLWPAIQGQDMEDVPAFAESVEGGYQSKPVQRSTWVRSVRTKQWKFIARMTPRGDEFELYNLVDDPGETDNVADEYPHVVGEFILQLSEWITRNVDDRLALEQREEERALRLAAQDPANLTVPEVIEPKNGDTLYYDTHNGAITAEWTGNPYAAYVIEYDVGEGWHRLQGKFPVDQGTKHVFGPLPKDGWKPLYQWNPYRVRVRPRGLPDGWSEWITVNVAPLPKGEGEEG